MDQEANDEICPAGTNQLCSSGLDWVDNIQCTSILAQANIGVKSYTFSNVFIEKKNRMNALAPFVLMK